MGGRGASSGVNARASRPSYAQETEKAVKLKLTVQDADFERSLTREVWVPKSQLAADGRPSVWITEQKAQEFYGGGSRRAASQYTASWEDAKGKKFGASPTQKEIEYASKKVSAYQAGVRSYNDLLSEAKAAGIKGVRKGMKRKTIEAKIREAKK